MKLTYSKLLNSVGTIQKLGGIQLPIKISYKISKNIKAINSEIDIYNMERQKLIDRYAEKDAEGKPLVDEHNMLKITDMKSWNDDNLELSKIEVDVDIIPISIEDLINCNCSLSPMELMTLDFMIKE